VQLPEVEARFRRDGLIADPMSFEQLNKFIDAEVATWKPVMERAIRKGITFLAKSQRSDGSWIPLWFGNEHAVNDENPVYGTAQVLVALRELDERGYDGLRDLKSRAVEQLVAAPVAGVLADVGGLDEAGDTEGVTEVKLLVDPGSTIGTLESSDSRVAYVRAVGKTADLAVNAARKAAAHLEFQLRVRAVSQQMV